jgi:hypothetical protein
MEKTSHDRHAKITKYSRKIHAGIHAKFTQRYILFMQNSRRYSRKIHAGIHEGIQTSVYISSSVAYVCNGWGGGVGGPNLNQKNKKTLEGR